MQNADCWNGKQSDRSVKYSEEVLSCQSTMKLLQPGKNMKTILARKEKMPSLTRHSEWRQLNAVVYSLFIKWVECADGQCPKSRPRPPPSHPHPSPVIYMWLQSSCGLGDLVNMKHSCGCLACGNAHTHKCTRDQNQWEHNLHPNTHWTKTNNSWGALIVLRWLCCPLIYS